LCAGRLLLQYKLPPGQSWPQQRGRILATLSNRWLEPPSLSRPWVSRFGPLANEFTVRRSWSPFICDTSPCYFHWLCLICAAPCLWTRGHKMYGHKGLYVLTFRNRASYI
jgi:hypothetical protein